MNGRLDKVPREQYRNTRRVLKIVNGYKQRHILLEILHIEITMTVMSSLGLLSHGTLTQENH